MAVPLWTDFDLFGDPRLTGYECQQVMADFKKIRVSPKFSKLRSIDVSSIHRQSLHWLKESLEEHSGQTNVVIIHHGPSPQSLPDTGSDDVVNAAYVSNLEAFIKRHKPAVWVHDHLHNSSNYSVGNCRMICNPRGYPDERNPDFVKSFTFVV